MKKTLFLLSIFLILLSANFALAGVQESPAPPSIIINQTTKECTNFWLGDECVRCQVPTNWETYNSNYCPIDYKRVDLDVDCEPLKTSFCCSQSHSGGDGDCEDLIININEKKCSFVEDINTCPSLVQGWQKVEDLCPLDYQWVDGLASCQVVISNNQATNTQEQNNSTSTQKWWEKYKNYAQNKTFLSLLAFFVVLAVVYIIFKMRQGGGH